MNRLERNLKIHERTEAELAIHDRQRSDHEFRNLMLSSRKQKQIQPNYLEICQNSNEIFCFES